jgi:hypothetical protein
MGEHQKSATRREIAVRNDGFLDGVCHAIDELRFIANAERAAGGDGKTADAYADTLEKNLFKPQVQSSEGAH